MYQFDLLEWDSLAVTRRFYNYTVQDTIYTDFIPASNNRVYFIQFEILSGFISLGHILQPDSIWGIAGHELITIGNNRSGPEVSQNAVFGVTRAHYSHPRRYRFTSSQTCIGSPVIFRMNEIRNMSSVAWDMGDGVTYVGDSLYDPSHSYTVPGRYLVKATAQFCGQTIVMEDSVIVAAPPAAWLPDTIVCDGSAFTVNAYQSLALSEAYSWSDGDTNAVRRIDTAGWWWVDVQGRCGSFRDSFYVSYDSKPFTGLPSDTFYCSGTTAELQLKAGNYLWFWPDSSTNSSYFPLQDESSVTVRLENHCGQFTETIQINRLEPPNYPEIDTVYCQGLPYMADLNWDSYTRIRWDDGDTSRIRRITKVYAGSAEIRHPCGDQNLQVSINRERCDCNLFLPTAFSPNNDGLNDTYAPVYDCKPKFFEMIIFDRWGKVVFETMDYTKSWDGTINSQPAESGFYAVRVSLVGVASNELRTEGTSVLLRR